MNTELYPLLSNIGSPADMRELDEDQLPQFADELRRYLEMFYCLQYRPLAQAMLA